MRTGNWFALTALLTCVDARKTRLTWINGIAHNLDHMDEGRQIISKYFAGKPILFCYNPTAMSHDDDVRGYLTDLTQAGQQKLGIITEEVESLVRHLKKSVAAVGKNGCVVHIAHSQGALITSLATQQLSLTEMGQMEILAFGGAAALRKTPQTPFKRCINYYSVNDPLLMVVPSAAQALRSGLLVGDGDDEFCFLAPRIGDPIQDHNLWGPTYRQALQWEGDRFQRTYLSPLYRISHFLTVFMAMILQAMTDRFQSLSTKILSTTLSFCSRVYINTVELYSEIKRLIVERLIRPLLLVWELIMQMWRRGEKYDSVAVCADQSVQ